VNIASVEVRGKWKQRGVISDSATAGWREKEPAGLIIEANEKKKKSSYPRIGHEEQCLPGNAFAGRESGSCTTLRSTTVESPIPPTFETRRVP